MRRTAYGQFQYAFEGYNRNVYGVFLGKLSFQLNTKNNFTFCRSYNKVQKFTPKLYSSRKTEKLCIFFSFLVCNINKK